MPEVVRGSRQSVDEPRPSISARRNVHFGLESPPISEENSQQPLSPLATDHESPRPGRKSTETLGALQRRHTERPEDRPAADAYYDSRAATKREFKRRASTLQEYYRQHPTLLPQLPFTWRHGWRRFKLGALIFLMFVDACVIPIILYYSLKFAGHVEGWIIFAVVATIWGGPTYVEFAVRSWRLIKKEDFFRPLGTKNRWAFDMTHWLSSFSIAAITVLLIIGSAPHIVWIRVLSLPGPALLLCLGGGILAVTLWAVWGKPAPFRISSTPKGGKVLPAVLYLIEDVVAVNANAGRPYREALHARYAASPRFRRMIMNQSLFWGIPSTIIGIVLIVVIGIHETPKEIGYGLGWGIPFFWALVWAFISVWWARRDMHKETITWEMDERVYPGRQRRTSQPEVPLESDTETDTKPPVPEAQTALANHTLNQTDSQPLEETRSGNKEEDGLGPEQQEENKEAEEGENEEEKQGPANGAPPESRS